jgi:hypothetical protein
MQISKRHWKKRKAAHALAASSQRKRHLTPSRHRRHDWRLGKGALVIPQLFGSLRHRPDWQGFAVGGLLLSANATSGENERTAQLAARRLLSGYASRNDF